MIIPVTISPAASPLKLPSGLARLSHDEYLIIELQGALDVGDGPPDEKNGKFVGKLTVDDELVSTFVSKS